ncbi:MAG TPA: hypothetical protein VJ867_17175 [Gemmatimonadaceae bacterium]|nr:hypothetical protein [Gemmatimonadaceae bacterium]
MRRAAFVAAVMVGVALPLHAQVRFERTGYRLTSIGERMPVSARVTDGGRRPVPNARIQWHIADSTIATVTSSGVVVSRRPGYTKLWAVSGSDSASALILVDQWAAKFDFSPAAVRFDAVGSKLPLRVVVRDAAGHVIPEENRRTTSCRSLNERVASLALGGELTARSNGVTYVRCSDRGIADSVRVEVRQRAVRAVIAEKVNLTTKSVGDTFQIRLSALDRVGDEIRDVQATWASLSPTVVSIDPLSGKARSVGPGIARIVAQVGDATDTVSITVNPGFGMPMPAPGDSGDALPRLDAPRVPTLSLQPLYLMVGDTGRVSAVAKDAAGNTISNPGLSFRSNDTSVVGGVVTRSGQGWVARRTGVTYLVAQFGSIVDSLQVSVRAKGTATTTLAGSAAAITFARPRFDTAAARRVYAQRLDSAARAIRRSSIVKDVTGRMLSLSANAAQVSHASHISRAFTERRTGLMYGGSGELAPVSWARVSGDFRTGLLSTNQPTGEDMTVTEAQADITFAPAPWFGFGGGFVRRVEQTETATQRWDFPRVSAMARLPFVGGRMTTLTGLSLLPGASYTGYTDSLGVNVKPNPFSMSGEAGLEVRTGVLSAAVTYYVESFGFPVVAGEKRRDEFSMLRLRVGLQAGR